MPKYVADHPAPPNKPRQNWVDKVGGLPKPIDAVMRALMAKGWSQQRAVATAVNHVKKVCATGRAFGGKTPVSGEARATACRAAAEWEAKKARPRALSMPTSERRVMELAFARIESVELAAKKIPAKAREKAPTAYGTSFPIRNVDELRRAISAYGRAPADKRATVRAFILRRAKALGAMNLVPDSWKGGREMAEGELRAAVELAERRGCTVELARRLDLAGRQGLVPVKVKVTNRRGTTFMRTMWVRPGQAKAATSQKRGQDVSVKGRDVQRQERSVLQELGKIPRGQRPAGWDEFVRQVASGPTHGGRLGPAKRKALRALQANAPDGSPLKAAVTGLLKADAKPNEKKQAQRRRRQNRRARRTAERGTVR